MKKSFVILLLLAAIVVLPGCISIKSSKSKGAEPSLGGIFKSIDRAEVWAPSSNIASTGDDRPTIQGFDIATFTFDPQDHNAVYVGTKGQGMFLSYNGGESWQQFKTLAQGNVNTIAVHPQDKCTIFVGVANQILKSEDCSRTWGRVYFDTRTDLVINTVAVDWFNPKIIYAGTSEGDILQSNDGSKTWFTSERTDHNVVEIVIGADTNNVYAATENAGLYISSDKGRTWKNVRQEIEKISSVDGLKDITLDFRNNVIVIANNFGLLKSKDNGKTWEKVELITPEYNATIYSVAVNPGNHDEMYYGTSSVFYKTTDGGRNWESTQLPTASIPRVISIIPSNHDQLFIGFEKIVQQ